MLSLHFCFAIPRVFAVFANSSLLTFPFYIVLYFEPFRQALLQVFSNFYDFFTKFSPRQNFHYCPTPQRNVCKAGISERTVEDDELPDLQSREKSLIMFFRGEMSKRMSRAFAVTEGKVHLALPENCPYKVREVLILPHQQHLKT